MCGVAAELSLLLLHATAKLCCVLHDVPHATAELCCVLYDVLHYGNKMPRKALLSNNITSILLYVLGRKSAHVLLISGKNMFLAGRYIFNFGIVQDSIYIYLFFSLVYPNKYIFNFLVLNVSIRKQPRV